jgi:hypothetical protein
VCREFQEFVQSVNYKELSASISTLKKSVERVKSSTYLDEIMMKVKSIINERCLLFRPGPVNC